MKKLWRFIRGVASLGIAWGAAWGVIGAGIGVVIGLVNPAAWGWTNPIVVWGLGMGMYGFVAGASFGKALGLIERRKTLSELSLGRVALWGLLGAAAVPSVFAVFGWFAAGTTAAEVMSASAVTALLGGLSATSTIVLARQPALEAGELPGRLDEASPRNSLPVVSDGDGPNATGG